MHAIESKVEKLVYTGDGRCAQEDHIVVARVDFHFASLLGCSTLPGHLFWLGMEAPWCIMVETVDSIIVALVYGVRVKCHTLASYSLQPGNPSPCRIQVQFDLVWLTRQIGCAHGCPSHWITVELGETFKLMESSVTECVRTGGFRKLKYLAYLS